MVKITPLIQLTLKRNDKILFIIKKRHAFKLKVNSSARIKISSNSLLCPAGNFFSKNDAKLDCGTSYIKIISNG